MTELGLAPGSSWRACRYRSDEPIRTEAADLCGMRGQRLGVYRCDYRDATGQRPHPECALRRYCRRQTVPVCYSCADAQSVSGTEPRE